MSLRRVVLPVVLIAAGGVGSALAQDAPSAKPAAVKDRASDVKGPLDLRRVALGLTPGNQLRADLTVRKDFTADDLRTTSGQSGSLCVRIFTKRDPVSEPPDYLVCATPAGAGDVLVGRVLRDRANGRPRRVGIAVVARPTARTIYVRFAQTLIGKPAKLAFSGESISRVKGCPKPLGCRDTAPDAPAVAALQLR